MIEQKTVLITGASKGIGLATTEALAKLGYHVHATARDPENAHALQALAKQHPNISISQLDVTHGEEIIFEKVRALGKIDILINNAGIAVCGPAEAATKIQRRRIWETNYEGVVDVTNAVLPSMRERNSGRIITISSVVGPLPDPHLPDYSASKGAVETWTAVLRKNLNDAGFNIIVANIHPGPVLTEIEASTPDAARFLDVKTNPYPQAVNAEKWRTIMRNGRPVSETVETIVRVINVGKPNFWNPTEGMVEKLFARVYIDPTGNSYMAGVPVPEISASLAAMVERGSVVSPKSSRKEQGEDGGEAPQFKA